MNNVSNNKNVWIFHHYATPPTMTGLTRPYDFGVYLKKHGYHVKVFSASFLHYSNINLISDISKSYVVNNDTAIPFIFINTPSSSNNLRRLFNMVVFYKRLFRVSKQILKSYEKPDAIIASSPHPLTMVAGIKIAKKLDIPCICEVRDFWPEVFFINDKLKEKSVLGKMLIWGEHWIYKNADSIIFLKEGDKNYIKEQGWSLDQGGDISLDKCYYINNGVNIKEFKIQTKVNILDDQDLKNDKFKVVYTGAIRPVNNVGNILDTALLLREYPDIEFLIYGDGNLLDELQKRIRTENITNVKFKGHVEKKYMPYILSRSSVNLLNYSQDKYNWSRGNSSNKLFEYMASGKPIISTVKMGYCLLEKYQCGFSLENDTPEQLAKTILKIYRMPESEYKKLGANATKGARDFDYAVLSKKLMRVLEATQP